MVQKLVRDVDRDCLKSPPPGRPLWDSHFLQWPWVAVFPFEFCQRDWLVHQCLSLHFIRSSLSLSRRPWSGEVHAALFLAIFARAVYTRRICFYFIARDFSAFCIMSRFFNCMWEIVLLGFYSKITTSLHIC